MAKPKSKLKIDNFNVLYDNIFVKGIEVAEVDGVLTPSSYEDKPELGEVIKVGEGRIFDNGNIVPLRVSPGDVVYFNKYSSTKFRLEGEDYFVVREEDVVAFVR